MAELIKVSLRGTLPGGEVFSVNPVWKILTGAAITHPEAVDAVNAINAITIPTDVKSMMTSACFWTGCRVEARGIDGTLETLAEGDRATPVAGTGASGKPFQAAMVLSLRTSTPGGRGRGRLYFPATGVGLTASTLRVGAGDQANFLAGLKTYIAAVGTALDASVDESLALAVWSRTAGALPQVNNILLGDILDTQRRRRDSVSESYMTSSWP